MFQRIALAALVWMASIQSAHAAESFTNHVRDLDDWVRRMQKLGAVGADTTPPPDKLPLVQIAHGLLGRDCATTAGRHLS